MEGETVNNRKLRLMEQVKTKVWKVKIKVPTEIQRKNQKKAVKTIDWSFKLMLN